MLLMIPGPVTMDERVRNMLSQPIIAHRTPEYRKILRETVEGLKWLLHTDATPFLLASSGTGAMDAAIANIIRPGDKVINILGGKFGERLAEISAQYGAHCVPVPVEWGRAVDLDKLKETIDENPDVKIVTFTHNETSTGVLQPAMEISEIVHARSSAVLLVDAVSNLGGDDILQDEWQLDIVVSGSQKCLGVPPGLGIVSVLPSAWKLIAQCQPARSFYFNLLKMKHKWEKDQDTPWTSAISLVRALHESLRIIREEGYANRVRRHKQLANMVRQGFKALGFSLFADPLHLSNTVTSLVYPVGIDEKLFKQRMKDNGVEIAASQNPDLSFARIATMGECSHRDVLTTIAVAVLTMRELGVAPEDIGSGLSAAIEAYLE
ncbi:MAG: pyridoxal-phosphate-dependent aminotransferase family protein [Candidatus Ranarchaeia archaeon]